MFLNMIFLYFQDGDAPVLRDLRARRGRLGGRAGSRAPRHHAPRHHRLRRRPQLQDPLRHHPGEGEGLVATSQVSLAFGLAVAAIATVIGPISGGGGL